MGTRESYTPGTFSWAELATTDGQAAKDFYAKLFGWEYDDNDLGEGGVYSMAKIGDAHVGAIFQADGPARWNSYVTVADVAESTQKARDAGANVHADPFDVMDAGKMAVIQDPTGGVVSLWEAKDHIGAGLVNAHGALSWNDLMTHDVAAATEFYTELFGWEVGTVEGAPDDRVLIRNGERLNGGMATIPESAGDQVPPHWLPYFAVDDVDAAVSAVPEAGGTVMADPVDVPAGRFALLADPQGAVFAIFTGDLDD